MGKRARLLKRLAKRPSKPSIWDKFGFPVSMVGIFILLLVYVYVICPKYLDKYEATTESKKFGTQTLAREIETDNSQPKLPSLEEIMQKHKAQEKALAKELSKNEKLDREAENLKQQIKNLERQEQSEEYRAKYSEKAYAQLDRKNRETLLSTEKQFRDSILSSISCRKEFYKTRLEEISYKGPKYPFAEQGDFIEPGNRKKGIYTAFSNGSGGGSTGIDLVYDKNKNLIEDDKHRYYYDAFDRLVRVEDKTTNSTIAKYIYDAYTESIYGPKSPLELKGCGRRVEKIDYVKSETERYDYDGYKMLERIVYDLNTNQVKRRDEFIWGTMGELLVMIKTDEFGAQRTYYYHEDGRGNIVAITDEQGNVVERYTYQPYGNVTIRNADNTPKQVQKSAIDNPFSYEHCWRDEETNFYYMFHRYYNPDLGRFNSKDPLGIWHDRYNLGNGYTYVGDNPINRIDPLGLQGERGTFKLQITPIYKEYSSWLGKRWDIMASAYIEYTPPSDACCDKINFIQTVRANRNNEIFYVNKDVASTAIENGTSIDWESGRNDWLFYITNPTLGHIGQKSEDKSSNAWMGDTPQITGMLARTYNYASMDLETCAVCEKGGDALKIYGCRKWGVEGSPEWGYAQLSGGGVGDALEANPPSDTFLEAFHKFRNK